MRSIGVFAAAAALVAAAAMIGTAGAQSQAPAPSPGSMMGTQGPGGAMGPGGMGSSMMSRMMGGSGMMGGMGPGMMGQALCSVMTGHIEGRLAYLKAELKITTAQEPLWNAFAAAARENAKNMLARCTAMMGQSGAPTASLPDRLDQHEQFMAARLEAVRAMSKALKPLYAALDDSQKQTVDQLFMGRMGMM
jgi:LTXXQ motif family protein